MGWRKRRVKFHHERIDWENHLRELNETNVCANGMTGFDKCFCMRLHHFDHLASSEFQVSSCALITQQYKTPENQ
jgi:hypothetical protein